MGKLVKLDKPINGATCAPNNGHTVLAEPGTFTNSPGFPALQYSEYAVYNNFQASILNIF
jgi:hypothetical protein